MKINLMLYFQIVMIVIHYYLQMKVPQFHLKNGRNTIKHKILLIKMTLTKSVKTQHNIIRFLLKIKEKVKRLNVSKRRLQNINNK